VGPTPYFILIDRALRDEGTSYHYLPPGPYSIAPPAILDALDGAFNRLGVPVIRGAAWTTDAPFRETAPAIETMKERGLLAVEMEATALYTFAEKCGKQIICFAHVTNRMGQIEGDFEKGTAAGTDAALAVVSSTVRKLVNALKID
jgi:uridine phosphorylase